MLQNPCQARHAHGTNAPTHPATAKVDDVKANHAPGNEQEFVLVVKEIAEKPPAPALADLMGDFIGEEEEKDKDE